MHCAIHHYPMGVGEGRLYSPSTSHHTVSDFHALLWDVDDQLCYVSYIIIRQYWKLVKVLGIEGKY